MNTGELILYKPDNSLAFQIEVRVEDESVWLNRQQIALLFDKDIKTIGKHINNVLQEELKGFAVVAKFATTAKDGKTYQVEHYNLDMIISVGYRVKSKRGIQFRIWANNVLKNYLLKGYAINSRLENLENKIYKLETKTSEIDLKINTHLPPNQGIFYDGQIFDAWQFVTKLVKSAKSEIIIIDNYIDETVLTILLKRKKGVKAILYTKKLTKQFLLDLEKHNQQYDTVNCFEFKNSHDRFLIIDKKNVYHIGASIKDLGKSWFAFSKMNLNPNELIDKLLI